MTNHKLSQEEQDALTPEEYIDIKPILRELSKGHDLDFEDRMLLARTKTIAGLRLNAREDTKNIFQFHRDLEAERKNVERLEELLDAAKDWHKLALKIEPELDIHVQAMANVREFTKEAHNDRL